MITDEVTPRVLLFNEGLSFSHTQHVLRSSRAGLALRREWGWMLGFRVWGSGLPGPLYCPPQCAAGSGGGDWVLTACKAGTACEGVGLEVQGHGFGVRVWGVRFGLHGFVRHFQKSGA